LFEIPKEEENKDNNNDKNKPLQIEKMHNDLDMDLEPPVKLDWDIESVVDLDSFLQCSFPSSPLNGEMDCSFPQGSPNHVPDLISVDL